MILHDNLLNIFEEAIGKTQEGLSKLNNIKWLAKNQVWVETQGIFNKKSIWFDDNKLEKLLAEIEEEDITLIKSLTELFKQNHRDPRLYVHLSNDLATLRFIIREIIEKSNSFKLSKNISVKLKEKKEMAIKLLNEIVLLSKEYTEHDISSLEIISTIPIINSGRKQFYLGKILLKPGFSKKSLGEFLVIKIDLQNASQNDVPGIFTVDEEGTKLPESTIIARWKKKIEFYNKISLLLRKEGLLAPKYYFYQNIDGQCYILSEPFFGQKAYTEEKRDSKIFPVNDAKLMYPINFSDFSDSLKYLRELGLGFATLYNNKIIPAASSCVDFFGGIKIKNKFRPIFFDFEFLIEGDDVEKWILVISTLGQFNDQENTYILFESFVKNLNRENKKRVLSILSGTNSYDNKNVINLLDLCAEQIIKNKKLSVENIAGKKELRQFLINYLKLK